MLLWLMPILLVRISSPPPSFKEQNVPTSKEQSAPTDFVSGSEPSSSGKNVLPLSNSSSGNALGTSPKNALGSSSKNALGSSSMSILDFFRQFNSPPKEGTKNFQSYIGELLEKQIIGDPQLIRFIENLEEGELINPISQGEALTSTPLTGSAKRAPKVSGQIFNRSERAIGLVQSHSCKKSPCSSETRGGSGRNSGSLSEVRVSSCLKDQLALK